VAVFVLLEDLDAELVHQSRFLDPVDGVPQVGEAEAVGALVEGLGEGVQVDVVAALAAAALAPISCKHN
jgi:hypothetical protein